MKPLENIVNFLTKHKVISGIAAFEAAKFGLVYAFFPEETTTALKESYHHAMNNIPYIALVANATQNELVHAYKYIPSYSETLTNNAINIVKNINLVRM